MWVAGPTYSFKVASTKAVPILPSRGHSNFAPGLAYYSVLFIIEIFQIIDLGGFTETFFDNLR